MFFSALGAVKSVHFGRLSLFSCIQVKDRIHYCGEGIFTLQKMLGIDDKKNFAEVFFLYH
jgi:hypothetical protein